ncbi:MAG: 3-deoxy-7-phosphoheptulonate synthase, partial [Bacillota bacterium]
MIVVLKDNPNQKQLDNLIQWLTSLNIDINYSQGKNTTILGLIGDTSVVDIDLISALEIVDSVKRITEP